jgi:nitroreductase
VTTLTFAANSKTIMITAEAFNQLARNRRSVFPDQFEAGKKIDDTIIREILTNAAWAPNHGKEEPWRFTVFTGDGLKKLAAFQSELYKQEAGENFKEATYIKLQQNPLKASCVIAIAMKRSANKNIPETEDIAAVACAIENIYLSVTAYGLGGYLTTGGVTYKEKAKAFFNLEEKDKLIGFFYMGHIAVPSVGAKRLPLEERVNWITQ